MTRLTLAEARQVWLFWREIAATRKAVLLRLDRIVRAEAMLERLEATWPELREE